MRKKSIEELQAELALESEALATLQVIYAEKVKQVRTNTALPPDIQARFLAEWETFYQQRVTAIFRRDYKLSPTVSPVAATPAPTTSTAAPKPIPAPPPPPPLPPSLQANKVPPTPPGKPPAKAQPLSQPAAQAAAAPQPTPPPSIAAPSPAMESNSNDDILGVNTDSWMNAAESLTYEQYNNNSEPMASSLMDSDKAQADSLSSYPEEQDSIDGYAATSGLKGLTEFMDFDLKKKKN
ncbi:MAG: hypothetical protein AB1489_04085 [Acidobacteriota bacterium]